MKTIAALLIQTFVIICITVDDILRNWKQFHKIELWNWVQCSTSWQHTFPVLIIQHIIQFCIPVCPDARYK